MENKNIRKLLTILLTFFILQFPLSMLVSPARAAERSFQISPPILELAVEPGKEQQARITITNKTPGPVSLEAFVRDFVVGGEGDEPRILGEDETSSFSLKNWLLLSEKQFILQPNEERSVTVTIALPKDAEPGGHYGLVGFTEPNTTIKEGVAVKAGVASLFFVTVAGNIKEAAVLKQFSAPGLLLRPHAPLTIDLLNTGNVHLKPSGTIRIANMLGREVATLPINPDRNVVLPDSLRPFTTVWEAGGAFGYYQASATLTISPRGETLLAGPISFWVVPIRQVAIGLLALIILVLLLYEYEHIKAHRRARHGLTGEGAR